MIINDLLKKQEFKELGLFLTSEMKKLIGNELYEKMVMIIKSEENARDWFYSPIFLLNGKRPYDYCLDGKTEEVERVLEHIEYGVF